MCVVELQVAVAQKTPTCMTTSNDSCTHLHFLDGMSGEQQQISSAKCYSSWCAAL